MGQLRMERRGRKYFRIDGLAICVDAYDHDTPSLTCVGPQNMRLDAWDHDIVGQGMARWRHILTCMGYGWEMGVGIDEEWDAF